MAANPTFGGFGAPATKPFGTNTTSGKEEPVRCGLVAVAERLAELCLSHAVPLQSVRLDVKVVDLTARVEVTQEFVNREAGTIECVYYFPVEEEAAVVEFTAELEGRTIKTEVKRKEEARKDYETAVERRQTAVLLEERKQDILCVKVGALSPGSGCTVRIVYLSELPVQGGQARLTVPTTVAPRYTTGQGGADLAALQHSTASPAPLTLQLQLVSQTEILGVSSPSHALSQSTQSRPDPGYHQATAKMAASTADMDRDLVVLLETAEPGRPRLVLERNAAGSVVAMLTLVPQFKLQDEPMEAVFLVDCSGSMQGQSIHLAREALLIFLHSLPATSHFNIVMFGSRYNSLYPASRPYDDATLGEAKQLVTELQANLGGTEILQPLKFVLQQPVLAGLARRVFLLTDGQVSNSSEVVHLVRKHRNANRVFSLGVGAGADRHLVKGAARAGGGTAAFTSEGEAIAPAVLRQLREARQPCVAEVAVRWGRTGSWEGGARVQAEIVETKKTLLGFGKPKVEQKTEKFSIHNQVPATINPIYDGQRIIVYKLLDETLELDDEVSIKAKTPEGDLEVSLPVNKDSFLVGNSLHQLCARKLIQEIEEEEEHEEPEASRRLIEELGLQYSLASRHTSFVGVDEKQGKVDCHMTTRQVPNQLPNNWGGGGSKSGFKMAKMAYRGIAAPGACPPLQFGAAPAAAAPSSLDRILATSSNMEMCMNLSCDIEYESEDEETESNDIEYYESEDEETQQNCIAKGRVTGRNRSLKRSKSVKTSEGKSATAFYSRFARFFNIFSYRFPSIFSNDATYSLPGGQRVLPQLGGSGGCVGCGGRAAGGGWDALGHRPRSRLPRAALRRGERTVEPCGGEGARLARGRGGGGASASQAFPSGTGREVTIVLYPQPSPFINLKYQNNVFGEWLLRSTLTLGVQMSLIN